MPLAGWFETVYLPRCLAACATGTIALYRYTLRHFRKFIGHATELADLTDANLLGFCRWRLEHQANQTTAAMDFGRLRRLWEWAARHRYLEDYPEVRCPLRRLERTPTAWRPEQMSRLVAACRVIQTVICGIPGSLWHRAHILVDLDTGLRRGALLSLRWEDVDLEVGTVLARAENAKTFQDEMHQLAPDTVAALRPILLPLRTLVFPWDKSDATYSRQFDKILATAGLPKGNRNKLHKVRRTSATWVAMLGGLEAARQHLGHKSAAMTLAHYVDQSQLPQTNWAARFPRP